MAFVDLTVAGVTTSLTLPSVTLPAGEAFVFIFWADPAVDGVTFSISHPAVGTWTFPAEGRVTVQNTKNSNWDLGAQVAHGSSDGSSGDLVVTASEEVWSMGIAAWSGYAAPSEVITASADDPDRFSTLALPFTASGIRLGVSFFDGLPGDVGGDWSTVHPMYVSKYRRGATAGESGSQWNLGGYAYAGVSVGVVTSAANATAGPNAALLGLSGLGV